jgi:competence protein ComEA
MRSRRSTNDEVAEVARRRLEQLSAELAAIRPDLAEPPPAGDRDGSGEPPPATAAPRSASRVEPGTGPGRHAHRSVGLPATVAGWVQDRLPPTLQGRLQMSAAHLGVVALMVLGGLAATAWWVSRTDGGESLVQPVAPVAPVAVGASTAGAAVPPGGVSDAPSGAQTGGPAGASSGTASALITLAPTPSGAAPSGRAGPAPPEPFEPGRIVVDVAGKVRRPGIATLPVGSRVVDALEAAGGARRGARLGTLNLARVLADGEQVVVGVPAPAGVAASAAANGSSSSTQGSGAVTALVNINTATQAELEALPDVGPVTAQAIIDFRAENGTFTAVEELLEVSGIGDATLAKIAPHATL